MKCQLCGKPIKYQYTCILCNATHCSKECLERHLEMMKPKEKNATVNS